MSSVYLARAGSCDPELLTWKWGAAGVGLEHVGGFPIHQDFSVVRPQRSVA